MHVSWLAIHLHRRVVHLLLTQSHFTSSRIASGAGGRVHIIGHIPLWSSSPNHNSLPVVRLGVLDCLGTRSGLESPHAELLELEMLWQEVAFLLAIAFV